MYCSRRFIFIVMMTGLFFPVCAQSFNKQQIELTERLDSLAYNAPPENGYIQTSKDIYEPGEDLWFKVYLLDAQHLTPSDLSKTLYLQLLNESTNKAVWKEKYEIRNGFANGQVFLNDNMPEGVYLLEAFTPNSLFNDSSEFKAVRRIILKTDIPAEPYIISKNERHLKQGPLQFTVFPEGGNLVSGIQNRVAFKAVNIAGKPVDVNGTLYDDTIPLLEFKSTHAGMGSFNLTPDTRKKYKIRLSEPATDSVFTLPEIYQTGISLQVAGRDKESLFFKVSQSPGLNPEDIYLRMQCRGIVYGVATGNLNGELLIKMPVEGLPQGIAEVTLFNSKLMPVAERLVYINQHLNLNISGELSDTIYPIRGKVILKISVKDEKGIPVAANLGVSVFDKLYQNTSDSNNILSHFYLSSQLKGRIYDPSYYFNSNSKGRNEALDLLMLTQGWRKYVWSEENLKRSGVARKQIVFDGIKGQLIVKSVSKKIRDERIFVMGYSPNKDQKKTLIPADSAREFTVSPDQLKEAQGDYVYLKPFWSHKYPPPLKMDDPFETINRIMMTKEISYPVQDSITSENEIPDVSINLGMNVIRDVTIKGNKSKVIRGKYMGQLDSMARLDMNTDYVCRNNILNCPNHPPDEWGTTKPVFGEFYYQWVAYGTPNAFVILTMYTMPKYSEEELLKMHFLSRVKAYYGNRKFYQPDYDKEIEDSIAPDFRNTLLWDPEVITDENGEATLSFFCSDINTDFVGRIEGVGGEGLLGTGNFNFTVRKLKNNP